MGERVLDDAVLAAPLGPGRGGARAAARRAPRGDAVPGDAPPQPQGGPWSVAGRFVRYSIAPLAGLLTFILLPDFHAHDLSIEDAFRRLDVSKDSRISLDEYILGVRQAYAFSEAEDEDREHLLKYYRRVFSAVDIDEDRALDEVEFEYSELLSLGTSLHPRAVAADAPSVMLDVLENELQRSARSFALASNGESMLLRRAFSSLIRQFLSDWGWAEEDVYKPETDQRISGIFQKADVVQKMGPGLDSREFHFAELLALELVLEEMSLTLCRQEDANQDGFIDASEVGKLLEQVSAMVARSRAPSRSLSAEPEPQDFSLGRLTLSASSFDQDGDKRLDRNEVKNVVRMYAGVVVASGDLHEFTETRLGGV